MMNIYLLYRKLLKKYTSDEIPVYAAQASFFIVLSFFPFLMLLLSLLQFIPAINKSDVMALLVDFSPTMLDTLILSIIDEVYSSSTISLLSLSGIFALWSSARGIMSIARGLDRIHNTTKRRNFVLTRIICAGYTFLFILAFIVSLILLVFGENLRILLLNVFPILYDSLNNIIDFRNLFAIILFLIVFIGLYTIVPTEKQNPWHQIPGAIFSTLGWLIFSHGFSYYVTNFSDFSYMYGSLTVIILSMLWIYFCICIIFVGAELNYFLYINKNSEK